MSLITPEQLTLYSSHAIELYRALETSIFEQIARQLRVRPHELLPEWQARVLSELGMLNNHVIKELSKVSGLAAEEIENMIKKTGYESITDIDKELPGDYIIKPMPNNLDSLIQAYTDQTFINIDNYVNQTLVSTQYGFGSVMKMYEDIINQTTLEHLNGSLTHKQALEKIILKWADKGVESTFIDKGGNTWSLERYVDMVLKSTLNNTYNELRTSRMAEYDIHTVLMGVVYDSADRCAYCQGKVLDMRPIESADSGYPSIYFYGYGTPGGTCGINCRHPLFVFIPGVSENNQPQIDPKEAIERSKVREKQRELERAIRKTKKNIIVLGELGSEATPFYKQLLRNQQAEMRNLLDGADWLRRQYGREKVVTPKETLMKGSL